MGDLNISVVVCTRNSARTIEACLRSIATCRPAELIIVDGDSSDETLNISRKYTDNIHSDGRRGLAYARQLGADKATMPLVCYVDSDVVLPPETLPQMLEEMERDGYAAIHASILGMDCRSYWEKGEDEHFRISFNKPGTKAALGTITCIYRRDLVEKYKFDPWFSHTAEDGDLSSRLYKNGYKLAVSSALAYHVHRAEFRSFLKQRYLYGKGAAQFFWKHRSWRSLAGPWLMVPYGLTVCLRQRSLRYLPFYLVWSASSVAGSSRELLRLLLGAGSKRRADSL